MEMKIRLSIDSNQRGVKGLGSTLRRWLICKHETKTFYDLIEMHHLTHTFILSLYFCHYEVSGAAF